MFEQEYYDYNQIQGQVNYDKYEAPGEQNPNDLEFNENFPLKALDKLSRDSTKKL